MELWGSYPPSALLEVQELTLVAELLSEASSKTQNVACLLRLPVIVSFCSQDLRVILQVFAGEAWPIRGETSFSRKGAQEAGGAGEWGWGSLQEVGLFLGKS